jgi:hypothetical protein
MTYKIVRPNKLTPKDITILELMMLHNFNSVTVFDIIFPERIVTVSNKNKSQAFRYLFEKKKDVTYEFIDNYYKTKFRQSFLSKERVMTDILDIIQLARKDGDYKTALSGYKQLADLMGLNILKSQIDINQTSLVLHYHTDQKNNDLNSGNTLLSITETGSSMENNQ